MNDYININDFNYSDNDLFYNDFISNYEEFSELN